MKSKPKNTPTFLHVTETLVLSIIHAISFVDCGLSLVNPGLPTGSPRKVSLCIDETEEEQNFILGGFLALTSKMGANKPQDSCGLQFETYRGITQIL